MLVINLQNAGTAVTFLRCEFSQSNGGIAMWCDFTIITSTQIHFSSAGWPKPPSKMDCTTLIEAVLNGVTVIAEIKKGSIKNGAN